MVLDQKTIDNMKIIEGMLFYYEMIEAIPFYELENIETSKFISNIVGEKLKKVFGSVYEEYIKMEDK